MNPDVVTKEWKHWHYKNTTLLILSLILFFFLADTSFVRGAIEYIGNLGYVGAFLVGILFVSIFTVAPASVVLFHLVDNLNPFGVALAAGAGGVVGDYIIFRYLKDRVFEEVKPAFLHHGGRRIIHLFKTPHFSWVLPIVGIAEIMSPFPDEVGIGLLGLSKVPTWKLIAILFPLDVLCVLLIVFAAKSF